MSKINFEERLKNYEPKITLEKTIAIIKKNIKHKRLVRKYCFKSGVILNGLLHDNSKWSPVEFLNSIRYYAIKETSPVEVERYLNNGISKIANHHLKRNKHHPEYWYDKENDIIYDMPYRYIVEMMCDMISAEIIYKGSYDVKSHYDFWKNNKGKQREKAILSKLAVLTIDLCLEEMLEKNANADILSPEFFKANYEEAKRRLGKKTLKIKPFKFFK